jgi:putative ABC transport system permease protein
MVPIQYNVRSLMVRKVTTLATAFGVALVVFVFAAALMLGEGVDRALATSGHADTAMILRDGSDSELASQVSHDRLNLLRERPEVSRGDGESVIGEIVVVITAEHSNGSGAISNVLVRGTPAAGITFRPEVKIVKGRLPRPGTTDVIVGESINGRFKGIELGKSFELRRNRPLEVVGVFSAKGTSYESEVWGDVDVIASALGRSSMVSSARVKLTSASQFATFKASLESDKQLGVEVLRETEYYKKQSEQTSSFLSGMGIAIAIMFSLAAMIGAAITMNGAVAHRTREIGTLRALGFSRRAILTSFVLESIVLALIGGVVGSVLVLVLGMVSFPVMNFQTFSEIVIGFHATPGIIGSSLFLSISMGLIGGMFPAIRAARVSPVEAMRG